MSVTVQIRRRIAMMMFRTSMRINANACVVTKKLDKTVLIWAKRGMMKDANVSAI